MLSLNIADITPSTRIFVKERRAVRIDPVDDKTTIVRKVAGGTMTRDTDLYTRALNIYSRARSREA
jgi:hypothetical protein